MSKSKADELLEARQVASALYAYIQGTPLCDTFPMIGFKIYTWLEEPKGLVQTCAICGHVFHGFGNNPHPIVKDEGARCCNYCDALVVVPMRLSSVVPKARRQAP